MIMKKLEKIGVTASLLGFGAMRFPLLENGKIDRVASAEMIDLAYKSGVNYYDTAYGYHDGESEVFLGEALKKYPRESFYLADKMPMFFCEKEDDVDRIFDEQLKRCQVEYFDFYLMHSLSRENWDKSAKYSAMDKMEKRRKAGQIKHFGFSYHGDYDTYIEILDAYDWDFVQLQFNYIDIVKLEADKFYDELARRNIPCIVMEPIRGGFLANLPESALAEMGAKDNSGSVKMAFRWLAGFENAPIILSGMSNLAQTKENIALFSDLKPLTGDEQEIVARVRDVIMKIQTVPCTGCAYCMDCPSGVDIPKVMHNYNDFKLYGNAWGFLDEMRRLGDACGKSCTECGVCVPKCPQSIDIPQWLKTIEEERDNTKL